LPKVRAGPGRLRDGKLVLDVRTVFPDQEDALVEALGKALLK
jgi:hypothetical protein